MNKKSDMTMPFDLQRQMKSYIMPISNKEKQLIDRCLSKDRLSQKQLYEEYYNLVFSVCIRYANNRTDAKGWVNLSYLKIFQYLNKFEGKGSFLGWIKRITINVCIDEIRKNKNYLQLIDSSKEVDNYDVGLEESLLDDFESTTLYKMIQELPPVSRSVFCLFVLDDYKHTEIAKLLSISTGTSRWHLSNAKQLLSCLLYTSDAADE